VLDVRLIQSSVSVVQWPDWVRAFANKRAPDRFALRFDRAFRRLSGAAREAATGRGFPGLGALRGLEG